MTGCGNDNNAGSVATGDVDTGSFVDRLFAVTPVDATDANAWDRAVLAVHQQKLARSLREALDGGRNATVRQDAA